MHADYLVDQDAKDKLYSASDTQNNSSGILGVDYKLIYCKPVQGMSLSKNNVETGNIVTPFYVTTDAAKVNSSETKPTSIHQSLSELDDNFRDIAKHRILSVAGK